MNITICGSTTFRDEMKTLSQLLSNNFTVKLPEDTLTIPSCKDRREFMKMHFKKIEWADIVLVYNKMKNGVDGYIGSNTLIEMGVAFYLKKKIALVSDIPNINSKAEIEAMDLILLKCNSLEDITPAAELHFLTLKTVSPQEIS